MLSTRDWDCVAAVRIVTEWNFTHSTRAARMHHYPQIGVAIDDWPVSRIPVPDEPTDTRPGSKARVEIYRERAERGEHLFHPDDLTCRATRSEWVWGEVPRPIVMMPCEDDDDE